MPGTHTHAEILSQPQVWPAVLDEMRARRSDLQGLWQKHSPKSLIFTGCGTTYYVSLSAADLAQTLLRQTARAWPASELWLRLQATASVADRPLLVAVSRSGETTETVNAVREFRAAGRGPVLTLTCVPDSALAKLGDVNIAFAAAQEQSTVQTRACSALLLACTAATSVWAGREDLLDSLAGLPEAARRVLATGQRLAEALGRDPAIDRLYFLGSGPRYGLACELSLKMKEASLSHSEPFHFLEFRHGPKSMAGPGALVVGLLSDSQRAAEAAVLDDARALGAQVFSIAERDADIEFASGLPESVRDVLYLLPGQLLALERALARGQDPDRPRNLSAVVRL